MYGGGNFDGGNGSQFNGAGFMPTQGAAGGGGAASGKKSYENKNQTLRACTIKQLHDACQAKVDDNLMLDGKDLTNVTIVGRVLSASESGLTYQLNIDDGTGKAAVKIWISDDDSDLDRQRRAEWRPGMYVRVHGHINTFNRSQEVVAFNIRPVADQNEITYHFLQCIFQHLHLTKGVAGAGAAGMAGAPASGFKQEAGGYGAAPAAAAPAGGYGGAPAAAGYNPNGGLNAIQNDIMAFFNAPDAQGDAGISLDDVLARAGGRYSMAQVKDAVEVLQNEGYLYSTIDESHFKSCNA